MVNQIVWYFVEEIGIISLSTVFLGHLPPQHASAENAMDCFCVNVGLFVQNVRFICTKCAVHCDMHWDRIGLFA